MSKFSMRMRKQCLAGLLTFGLATLVTTQAICFDKINKHINGVAIKGYDPVAYHSENRAVKGKREFSFTWNDAEWNFASANNRDLFAANPERYAPQYGGY